MPEWTCRRHGPDPWRLDHHDLYGRPTCPTCGGKLAAATKENDHG